MNFLIFFIIMFFTSLWGVDISQHTRLAEEYIEAGDYQKALDIYASLVDNTDVPWQQEAIYYNNGNALMLSGKTGDALLSYFQASEKNPFPELSARIAFNRAIGEINRASSMEVKDDDAMTVVYIALWSEAVRASELAEKAICERDKTLGSSNCVAFTDVLTLKKIAQQGLSNAIQRKDSRELSGLNVNEGIEDLLKGVNGLLELTQIMSAKGIHKDTVEQYQHLYVLNANSWNPFWEILQNKLKELSDFSQAFEAYTKASTLIQERKIEDARHSLRLTSRLLSSVESLLPPIPLDNPKAVLQKLIEKQNQLLNLNRSYNAEDAPKMSKALSELQEKILEEARKFPESIKVEEEKQWKDKTFQKLTTPWKEISSLFDEGYTAASSAYDELSSSQPSPEDSISFQKLAFDNWVNALALLTKMKSQEKELASKATETINTPPANVMMQQLEAMEQDDKSLSSSLEGVKPEKVDKPW